MNQLVIDFEAPEPKAIEPGSQNWMVLQHLREGRTITALESLQLYGVMRLAPRVKDLRNLGHVIETEIIELPNKKRIAKYRMPT